MKCKNYRFIGLVILFNSIINLFLFIMNYYFSNFGVNNSIEPLIDIILISFGIFIIFNYENKNYIRVINWYILLCFGVLSGEFIIKMLTYIVLFIAISESNYKISLQVLFPDIYLILLVVTYLFLLLITIKINLYNTKKSRIFLFIKIFLLAIIIGINIFAYIPLIDNDYMRIFKDIEKNYKFSLSDKDEKKIEFVSIRKEGTALIIFMKILNNKIEYCKLVIYKKKYQIYDLE
jgi:hypothetical protein